MLQQKFFHIFLILLLLLGGKFAYAGCTVSGTMTKAKLTTEATAGNDITTCNVSSLNDLSSVFKNITGFNQDISAWDVSNVTTMESMFEGASSFNQDISSWDVSSVTDMEEMFDGASAYNNGGAGLTWGSDTGSVRSMHEMFKSASSFNQNISAWDVSSVRDMKEMFKSASAYNNGGAALAWSDTGSVTTMQNMFTSASAFNNGDSGNNSNAAMTWDTSSVTNMNSMFNSAIKFNQDISSWNVSSVTNMSYMFSAAAIFNNGGVALDWVDLNDLVYAHFMFSSANSFNQSVSTWQLGSVQTMNNMFAGNTSFNKDISDWDVSTVTTFYWMFSGAAFNNGGVALDWTTFAGSSVSMLGMFRSYSVFNQDISSWNVTGVNNFSGFLGASYQFSQANYDLLLVAWDALNLTDNLSIDFANTKYTGCSAAATARASIISNDNWTINDGGATACPAPTLSSSAPADNATAVAVDANIVLTFDQAVDRESGNVTIKKTSDDSTIEAIAVTDSKITGTGTTQITINPTSALAGQTEYYVLIDATGFDNSASASYAGISSTTALSFTTADIANPTLSSSTPVDGSTGIAVDANIVLTFSEAVDVESGNIVIKKSLDDSIVETIDVTGSKVTGTGTTTITINPTSVLTGLTGYYLNIAATAFDDAFSNSYAGITDATTLNFATIRTSFPTPLDKPDVTGSIETSNDIAAEWADMTIQLSYNRIAWLQRNKGSIRTSHQGIKLRFRNEMIDILMNSAPNAQIYDEIYFANRAKDAIENSNGSMLAVGDHIKSDAASMAINEGVKLRERTIGSLNPAFEPIFGDWSVWTKGEIILGKTKATATVSKQDSLSKILSLGFDRPLNNDGIIGFVFDVGRDNTKVGTSKTRVKSDNYSLSNYTDFKLDSNTSLENIVGIGRINFDMTRVDGAETLLGERRADQMFFSTTLKREYKEDQLIISPFLTHSATRTNLNSFSEIGGETALSFNDQVVRDYEIGVGLDINSEITLNNNDRLRPFTKIEYNKSTSKTSASMYYTSEGPDNAYTTTMNNDNNKWKLRFGADLVTESGWRSSASYTRKQTVGSGSESKYSNSFTLRSDLRF